MELVKNAGVTSVLAWWYCRVPLLTALAITAGEEGVRGATLAFVSQSFSGFREMHCSLAGDVWHRAAAASSVGIIYDFTTLSFDVDIMTTVSNLYSILLFWDGYNFERFFTFMRPIPVEENCAVGTHEAI